MRRTPVLFVVTAIAITATVAHADTPAKPPKLAAKVTSCTTGADATARSAVFTGSMPRVAGAATMAMRFDLYERAAGAGWKRLSVPNFGVWVRSAPNVAGFIFDKRVEELAAPAAYRVLVRFRWYSESGNVLKRARRISASCLQPDLRPDLGVARIQVFRAAEPELARYVVNVHNAGRAAARSPFAVALTVNGQAQPVQSLPALEAGRIASVIFLAPRCTPGTAVSAEVDPDGGVDEADEADNVSIETCEPA